MMTIHDYTLVALEVLVHFSVDNAMTSTATEVSVWVVLASTIVLRKPYVEAFGCPKLPWAQGYPWGYPGNQHMEFTHNDLTY